ncbi:hypothetical protein ACR8AL_14235 [Clavibacter sepedonicus]|uniref:Uncharacterized protein n=1 Tax=Clavibacter sepedonicus TaxID=31964 RepID=B0RJA6_CLASE|nr:MULTISPECIES: hypothetical protein [Clavibacter]MBD5383129.1 hypothetical protein [Clavibacter sp.]OQJ45244.1 hypothetical protein B5P19_15370 [Clavibacter sepedonicus]OQJ50879.1 hypothetical protein B5P20_15705 [Clavibacter sepedonicus]UUK67321.1 hypothetical protein LRE50_16310 [Clavibacter sepedonicus]CAQ03296.1 hypothetical protein pCSL0053 [Clavibacter sepedonicus]
MSQPASDGEAESRLEAWERAAADLLEGHDCSAAAERAYRRTVRAEREAGMTRRALSEIRTAVDGANLDAGANASALGTIRLILEDAEMRRLGQALVDDEPDAGQDSSWT